MSSTVRGGRVADPCSRCVYSSGSRLSFVGWGTFAASGGVGHLIHSHFPSNPLIPLHESSYSLEDPLF